MKLLKIQGVSNLVIVATILVCIMIQVIKVVLLTIDYRFSLGSFIF